MLLSTALRLVTRRAPQTASASALAVTRLQHRRAFTAGDGTTSRMRSSDSSPTPVPAITRASAVNKEHKESRFTRSHAAAGGASSEAHGAADVATVAESVAGAAATAPAPPLSAEARLALVALPRETRSHRLLLMYLQRVQTALEANRYPAVEALARCELSKILLPAVKGLDAPTMVMLLQTLWMADAKDTAPVMQDAMAWLSLHENQLSLLQYVKAVQLLHWFGDPILEDLLRTLPQRLSHHDVAGLPVPHAVALLTSLLPRLRYPSCAAAALGDDQLVKEAEGLAVPAAAAAAASKANGEMAVDAALIKLAEQLRERCKGVEFVACDVALKVELLRSLLAFKSSRAWRFVTDKEAWLSLEEATCFILATPAQADSIGLASVARLVADLHMCARSQQQQQCHLLRSADSPAEASSNDTTASEAEDRFLQVLIQRLRAALRTLEVDLASGAAAPHSASPQSLAALPAPWRPRDLRELWSICLANSSCAVVPAAEMLKESGANAQLEFHASFTDFQRLLLTYVSEVFAAHQGDVGLAEMAVGMARGLADADRAAALRTRELLPITGDSPATATPSTNPSGVILTDVAALLPPVLLNALLSSTSKQLQEGSMTWTAEAVQDVVALWEHSTDAAHRTRALEVAQAWYTQLQARAQDGQRLLPQELLACFTPTLLRKERNGVNAAVDASLRRWSVSEVLFFFSSLGAAPDGLTATAGGAEGAAVLRHAGAALCAYASKASAAQLASLVECYGAAQVRNDDFCEAAVKRLAELLDASVLSAARNGDFSSTIAVSAGDAAFASLTTTSSPSFSSSPCGPESRNRTAADSAAGALAHRSPVTLKQLTQLLRSFALMEVRQTKPFLDAAPHITQAVNGDQGSAEEVAQLLAAYAKMLIWNYPVFRALAERLCRIPPEDVRLNELVTAQLALLRMDVTLPAVTERFYAALTAQYTLERVHDTATTAPLMPAAPVKSRRAELKDAVMHLSLLSRMRTRSQVPLPDPTVGAELVRFVLQRADLLRIEELAEVLLSLARLGEGKSAAFEELTVRTLGLLPTAPPRVMAHIAEAYALAKRSDDTELFTLIAERTVAMRHDMAAITIASILASFAKAGVRNDRLFIEVIPRVRQVGTYGTPRDVVNVVSAYAAVNLWHYKLFARLADRAIQLRADFRVTELVGLLEAYAKVQMRYDVLFTEFAPRIQTLAHLLTPADLAAIVSSYHRLNIPCVPVWKATAARAVAEVDAFTEAEAEQLLDAYSSQDFYDEPCVTALTKRFPALASIPFNTQEGKEDDTKEKESRSE